MIHGHATRCIGLSPTYVTWMNMLQRCYNRNHPRYRDYGERGIYVQESWHIFDNFLYDMGERPLGRQLDRVNNNKGYEISNCRWATVEEQALNKRVYTNNTSGYKGVSFHKGCGRWIAYINKNNKRIYLGYFDTLEEAVLARKARETL